MKLENAQTLFGIKDYFGMTSMTTPYARVGRTKIENGKLVQLTQRIALEYGGVVWASRESKAWMLQPKEV
jgi:hypothetical protein